MRLAWLSFGSTLIALATFGCGDDESSPDLPGSGTGGSGNAGTGNAGTGGSDSDCGDTADRAECLSCCNQEHPVGSAMIAEGFATECLCAATAPCRTECADEIVCGGGSQSQECVDCAAQLTDDMPCATRVAEECWADASCTPIMECFGVCPM